MKSAPIVFWKATTVLLLAVSLFLFWKSKQDNDLPSGAQIENAILRQDVEELRKVNLFLIEQNNLFQETLKKEIRTEQRKKALQKS